MLDLEVYVLNADTEIGDLHFPHSYDSDSTIHLSEATIKQYNRNGKSSHSCMTRIHIQAEKQQAITEGIERKH